MKGRWAKYVATGAMLAMLAACSSKPTDRGQQYSDGKFTQPFSLVNQPDAVGAPINAGDFSEQVNQIRNASPRLYNSQSNVYNALQEWLRAGGDTRTLRQFGIDALHLPGVDAKLAQRAGVAAGAQPLLQRVIDVALAVIEARRGVTNLINLLGEVAGVDRRPDGIRLVYQ